MRRMAGVLVVGAWAASTVSLAAEVPAGRFVEVASDAAGGHYFSQVIYAPTVNAVVSWGTQTHAKPIRTHETQHFPAGGERWIDAWPPGKAAWAGKFKQWGDWNICSPVGEFYTRDGVSMPRPNNSFHQVCWDAHNRRAVFYVGSMTFSYEPRGRLWKLIHPPTAAAQPPAMLIWSAMCYDPVNRRVILFGGGGIAAADGRPHTWALDVTDDTWRKLDLDIEPPARCNSRMVYDAKNRLIVLFGGDAQDRGLADTWAFDVAAQRWRQHAPRLSPHPRSCHAMAYLSKSGLVLLAGGLPVAPYKEQRKLAAEAWVYDAAAQTWTPLAVDVPECDWASMENIPGTDEVIFVTARRYAHERTTYRFRYDATIPRADRRGAAGGAAALKTERTVQWYRAAPPADKDAHGAFLADLPANRWVEAKVPRSAQGRTWGTAVFDTDLGLAMKWGGGHSGYQGTDMAFYDVAASRFTIDRTPAFTPEPFRTWSRRPAGRTFFNQPWTRHMRHTCAYDRVRRLGVFTDAGGSEWYDRASGKSVKMTWLYDGSRRRWCEPIAQPFPGGGTRSPIALPTPAGVVVSQLGRLYRFVGQAGKEESWSWQEIKITGQARPRQHEHMTIVYDSKRDRLVFLSAAERSGDWGHRGDGAPQLWFFSMAERRWRPNPTPAAGGVITREAVYMPDQDAILAYGPARKDDPVWTRVYLCAENRWVDLPIKTPQYLVHEVGLVYDPAHKLAVLMWPPRFERDIRPHLFRLDAARLQRK